MTSGENNKLILDHYEAFLHRQDMDAVKKQLAPDFVDHEPPPGTPAGIEGALIWRKMMHAAFPDLRVTIDDIVAEGDRAAVPAMWTGTHRGTLPGFTGCGKTQNAVILSEAKNLSLFVLLYLDRREILRFAQNDRTSHFFRSLFNLAPTNRSFVLKGMVFWRVRDGQIAERWATLDRLGLQQQLTAAS